MNRIEQQEMERRLRKAWNDGFSFGMFIGGLLGGSIVGGVVWIWAAWNGVIFWP